MKFVTEEFNGRRNAVPDEYVKEITDHIIATDCSSGKRALTEFRNELPMKLRRWGWSDNIFLDHTSRINITSTRGKTGLCIQTGNVSRIYADLLKLQALYMRRTINGGIVIVPTSQTGKIIGVNVASFDRLVRELPIFEQVITMPLVIIGFEV